MIRFMRSEPFCSAEHREQHDQSMQTAMTLRLSECRDRLRRRLLAGAEPARPVGEFVHSAADHSLPATGRLGLVSTGA